MDDREQQLRERAYQLWQAEGEPHGRDREHWEQAQRELGGADDATATPDADAAGADASASASAATGDEAGGDLAELGGEDTTGGNLVGTPEGGASTVGGAGTAGGDAVTGDNSGDAISGVGDDTVTPAALAAKPASGSKAPKPRSPRKKAGPAA